MISRSSLIRLLSVGVLIISLFVIFSWGADLKFFLGIFPGAPTMKFNTALLFLMSGFGLLSTTKKSDAFTYLNYLLGSLIIILSITTLIQYLVGIDFGIDNLLFSDDLTLNFPGRMSRATAFCFALFGFALINSKLKGKVARKLTKYSLAIIALISILAALTYFLQAFASTKVLIFNSMAFHTALSFFILSLGLSLCHPESSYIDLLSGEELGSKLARKLLPFLIFLPLALSLVLLYITATESLNTELGITLYTIFYAIFGIFFTSWVAYKLNYQDSERLELEKSLYKTNRELNETIRFKKQLVRTSPETIMIINLNDQKVRYINKDIYPQVGMNKEGIQGMNIKDILPYVHPRDRETLIDLHKKLLKSKDDDIHDIEIRLKLRGTNWEWFSVRGKVFHRKNENWVDEYVLLVRNINKQKTTQKDLINAEKFSIQGELARMLAHELRNPIASIGMATEVLQHKVASPQKEELENYFKILSRSAKTLDKLVTNILNSANYSPCLLKEEDLGSIIDSSIEKASDRIYLSGINVKKNYQEGSYPILADKEKLEMAFVNILVNASEAVIPDHGKIEINIENNNAEYILSISDNGHGLEADQIDKLFDAFYTNRETGVGVGLNSVKNILEEHDAKIEVCSKLNQGATFKMFFNKIEN